MHRAWVAAALLFAEACAGAWQGDGYDTADLPDALRADYSVFAQRCSRCHSLARPLTSGIDDDVFWRRYVERMRLKPESGISVADEEPILRFLHYYSTQRQRRKDHAEAAPSAGPADAADSAEAR